MIKVTPGYLRGLQEGEHIRISCGGVIWRMNRIGRQRNLMSESTHRLERATALPGGPEGTLAIRNLLNELLRAFGEPFTLEFEECRKEDGSIHVLADERARQAERDLDPELDDPVSADARPWDTARDGYFEAIFVVDHIEF